MIGCEEAAIICNKIQYQEAGFWEKIKLRLHVFICSTCKAYVHKNTKFTSLCKKAKLQGLSEGEKESLREQIANYKS